ncbi:MAG TPA: hypothetical protein VFL90_22325 [Methylomirabilota bacterium]|nr:hypothetical protein [Methylomirabilota bacterium]
MNKPILTLTMALLALAVTASAADLEYSGTFCGHARNTVLYAGPDLTVVTWESWGIQTPESTFEPWKNASVRCVGYGRVADGKMTSTGSCLWTDSTGDTFIGEFQGVPDKPGVWRFLSGTGKWKGITGGGQYQPVSRGKNFADATAATCTTHSGKYTLP